MYYADVNRFSGFQVQNARRKAKAVRKYQVSMFSYSFFTREKIPIKKVNVLCIILLHNMFPNSRNLNDDDSDFQVLHWTGAIVMIIIILMEIRANFKIKWKEAHMI